MVRPKLAGRTLVYGLLVAAIAAIVACACVGCAPSQGAGGSAGDASDASNAAAAGDAGDAAAYFDGDGVVTSEQVSKLVESYRKQQGFADRSDDDWDAYLADQGASEESIRKNAIDQLVIDAMIERRAADVGAEVDEEALSDYIETFKGNLAFGDDEIYRETLERQGQTAEEAEEGFRRLFLQQSLLEHEVPKPKLTDEQLVEGIKSAYPDGLEAKHVYRFTIDGFDEGDSYERFAAVQDAQASFASGEKTEARLKELVDAGGNDGDLKRSTSDDGWSVRAGEHNQKYQELVEELGEGDVSDTFTDDKGYSFIWIGETYAIEPGASLDEAGLAAIPESLRSDLNDVVGEQYWQRDCQKYLEALLEEADVRYCE